MLNLEGTSKKYVNGKKCASRKQHSPQYIIRVSIRVYFKVLEKYVSTDTVT